MILPNCLFVLYYIPCAVYYDDVLSFEAWACLHCEFDELGFDLFGYLAVVKSFEWDHLTENLGGLESCWIDFEFEKSFSIVCGKQEADAHGDYTGFEAILELQNCLIVFLRGFAAGHEYLHECHFDKHLQ